MRDPVSRPYLSAPDRPSLPALTGLRAVAAALVIGWHGSEVMGGPAFPVSHGYLGVDLFFMLSGFIISYAHWSDFPSFSLPAYGRFIALRLARLWPAHAAILLLFALLVVVTLLRAGEPPPEGFAREIVMQLLLVHNWGTVDHVLLNWPSWSISAEFLAYLAFPLYVALFGRLRSVAALLASIVLAMGLCWLLIAMVFKWPLLDPGPIANIRVACEFAIGVALFRLWENGGLAKLPWPIIVAGALAGIIALVALTPSRHVADYLIVLLMAPLILGLACGGGFVARFLSSRAMVYLGEISYSTYLIHALATAALEKAVRLIVGWQRAPDLLGWSLLLAAIALSFLAGAIVFHLIEKPARNWLRRRIERRWPRAYAP